MTDYPPLPFTPRDVPADLYPVWWAATKFDAWLVDWHDGDLLTCYPPALTTGHDVLCTARYDAEADCHELEGCALVDPWPYDEGMPPCTCSYRRRYITVESTPGRWYGAYTHCFLINPHCWHHGDRWRW